MPDLLLWREPPSAPADADVDAADAAVDAADRAPAAGAWRARVRLVEVKGPGDSLSAAQSAWIDVLAPAMAEGDLSVLHVSLCARASTAMT